MMLRWKSLCCLRSTGVLRRAVPLLLCAAWAGGVQAEDSVRTIKSTISGKVTSVAPLEVVVERGGKQEKIPVNEIRFIRWDDEPAKLDAARRAVLAGRYDACLRALAEVPADELKRLELQTDAEFFKVLSTGRLALAGKGNTREAGKQTVAFLEAHADSWHALAAAELLGDLLVSVGAHEKALLQYDKLANAPWPDYKLRAELSRAGALRAQRKLEPAIAAYDQALQLAGDSDDPLLVNQRLAATLGKAECLSEAGQNEPAIKLIEQVIAGADPEDAMLHAQAYNALGRCQRRAGQDEQALLAYLHVDVLYFSQPTAHAEALRNLAELWAALQQPQRAAETLAELQSRYQSSAEPPSREP